jgi:geranyl-CoA carboxylase alpha subunit
MMMIRKILVANRGEIACRIIHTCREMGFTTVAVFSDADSEALFVELADEAVHLGASEPSASYLNMEKILDAARRTGADAIHPGYGFLAENAQFAYLVKAAGLKWIGPSPEAIEAMGDKRYSKMFLIDVPYIPGYIEDEQDDDSLIAAAQEIGYPIMVKAAAGGGGKGMRLVKQPDALPDALASARREAMQAFGSESLMLERALLEPRHIEVQIFGDELGNVIALGERECSIQRRHQKIIEETPSTALNPELRRQMFETAISIGQQLGYYSAGTVEFLLDTDGNYYFMEMNTRLQVEHTVTELVYGIDLVRWQLEVARGVPLQNLLPHGIALMEFALYPHGHAIEVRVYAEDPSHEFLPVIGKVARWQAPPAVRTDTGIRSGDSVSPHYDPMLAKIVAHGVTRVEAIRRLDYALSRTQLLGIRNNINFLRRVLMTDEHVAGIISTRFLEEHPELMEQPEEALDPVALIAAAFARQGYQQHWRNNANRPIRHSFTYSQTQRDVLITPQMDGTFQVRTDEAENNVVLRSISEQGEVILRVNGHQQRATVVDAGDDHWWVHTAHGTYHIHWLSPLPLPTTTSEVAGSLRAPMTGKIIRILVDIGQHVEKGAILLILEAMKMEHRIEAPYTGTVESIMYSIGETAQQDNVLLALTPD